MIQSYYPPTNTGRGAWWVNMNTNATAVLTSLNAPASLIATVVGDSVAGIYCYVTVPGVYEDFGKRITGFNHSYLFDPEGTPAPPFPIIPAWPTMPVAGVLAGIEARRENWVQAIKKLPNYEPLVHGVTLRIEQTGTPFNPAAYKAVIVDVVSMAPHSAVAKFRKAGGKIDGVVFKGRKVGTTPLIDLGYKSVSPASLEIPIAAVGVAEEWEIQATAQLKDQLVGTPSDFKTVLVRG